MLLGAAYSYIDRDPHDTHGFAGAIPARRRQDDHPQRDRRPQLQVRRVRVRGRVLLPPGEAHPRDERRRGGRADTGSSPRATASRTSLQAGYLLPRILPLELGARWGQIKASGDPTQTSLRSQNELGGIINYFFARHALKLQLDYFHYWDREIRLGTDQVRLQLGVTF
jgi:hypothetical protein